MLQEKPIKIWDVNVDNIVISKLIKRKTNSKYLIGHLDKVIRALVLIMTKMSGYDKTFKVKDGHKDKNTKLMSLDIDEEKLLEKYKTIWSKIEDLKNFELNALTVYDHRYIKTKIGTYGDKVCSNFRGLNVLQEDIECQSLTFIFIDSLLVYENKYYLQVYLDNCAYKVIDKRMIDYLAGNLFED